jgi:hypothetical protein
MTETFTRSTGRRFLYVPARLRNAGRADSMGTRPAGECHNLILGNLPRIHG